MSSKEIIITGLLLKLAGAVVILLLSWIYWIIRGMVLKWKNKAPP